MGSGVARQVKTKYPEAYRLYREYCEANGHRRIDMLGDVQFCPVSANPDGTPRIYVANMFAQYDYGWSKYTLYTNYAALRQCLAKVSEFARERGLVVAIPAVSFYTYFKNRLSRIILNMEGMTLDLIKGLRHVEVVAE